MLVVTVAGYAAKARMASALASAPGVRPGGVHISTSRVMTDRRVYGLAPERAHCAAAAFGSSKFIAFLPP